jgi:hypothetical protein
VSRNREILKIDSPAFARQAVRIARKIFLLIKDFR